MQRSTTSLTVLISVLISVLLAGLVPRTSAAQERVNIDVLVAYTEAAARWAERPSYGPGHTASSAFGCELLRTQHKGIIRYGKNISLETSFSEAADHLERDWGIQHPCDTGLSDADYERDPGIHRLIDIAMAELNESYAVLDPDVEVTFTRVGTYKVALDSPSLPAPQAYREFLYNDFYGADKPVRDAARVAMPDADEITNLATLGVRGVCDRDAGCDRTFWPGDTVNALALDTVHHQRLVHSADLVILLTDAPRNVIENSPFANDGLNHTGIGEAKVVGVESAQNAFAWVSVRHATAPLYTFTHEVSHLMGANHYELGRQLGMQVQPNLVTPDLNELGQQDNLGSVQYRSGTYYGTLMTENLNCPVFYRTELEDRSAKTLDQVCRYTRTWFGAKNHHAFHNFLYLPRLSDGTVHNHRNNARVVANIERLRSIASFDQALPGMCRSFLAPDKLGFDFGASSSVFGRDVTSSNRKVSGFVGVQPDAEARAFRQERWLNLSSVRTGAAAVADGIRVEVVAPFFGRGAAALGVQALLTTGLGDMPDAAMRDGFDVNATRQSAAAPPTLRLSGLAPERRYHLRLFGSSPDLHEARLLVVIVNQRDPYLMHTAGNVADYLDLSHIAPNPDGTISLALSGFPQNERVLLNALQIYPEPHDTTELCSY